MTDYYNVIMRYRYHLNIGSNLGDRLGNLHRAVVALGECGEVIAVSSVVESAAWGFESEHAFLNVGVELESCLAPGELLRFIHDVEHRLGSVSHRDAHGNYADRVVDVDIIVADRVADNGTLTPIVVDDTDLQIPHKHMKERDFVMIPYKQLRQQ